MFTLKGALEQFLITNIWLWSHTKTYIRTMCNKIEIYFLQYIYRERFKHFSWRDFSLILSLKREFSTDYLPCSTKPFISHGRHCTAEKKAKLREGTLPKSRPPSVRPERVSSVSVCARAGDENVLDLGFGSICTIQAAARKTNECDWPLVSGSALITNSSVGFIIKHCPIKQLLANGWTKWGSEKAYYSFVRVECNDRAQKRSHYRNLT